LKVLYWDRDGFAVWAKRLEAGSFAIPVGEPGSSQIEITTEELGALLSGIDMQQVTQAQTVSTQRSINIKTSPLEGRQVLAHAGSRKRITSSLLNRRPAIRSAYSFPRA
jgi:hypothetical protein